MGCSSSSATNAAPNVHSKYQFERKLGQGSFGQVRVAIHVKTQKEFAVKILDLQPPSIQNPEKRTEEANRELDIWTKIGCHPHVVGLVESSRDSRFCYFVMEKCEYSILEMLSQKGDNCNEKDYFGVWRHILFALDFLHAQEIAHRDVKPANFLVDAEGLVKICDFGLSAVVPPNGLAGVVGTTPFMAPEIVQVKRYDCKSDIWSLGAMAFLMLYGHYPYLPQVAEKEDKEKNESKATPKAVLSLSPTDDKWKEAPKQPSKGELLRRVIAKGRPEPKYKTIKDLPEPSALARKFVETLLVRNPALRPSASECLQIPAIAEPNNIAMDFQEQQSVLQAVRLAQKATKGLRTYVDPTVAKTLDALIAELQKGYRNKFSLCFSEPKSTNGSSANTPAALFRSNSDGGLVSYGAASYALASYTTSSMRLSRHTSSSGRLNSLPLRAVARHSAVDPDDSDSTTASPKSDKSTCKKL